MSPSELAVHETMVWDQIRSGALVPMTADLIDAAATQGHSPIVHTCFVVPKPNKPRPSKSLAEAIATSDAVTQKMWIKCSRLVMNLKGGFNLLQAPDTYAVGSALSIRPVVRQGCFQIVIDVRAAYHCLKVRRHLCALMGLTANHESIRRSGTLADAGMVILTMAYFGWPFGSEKLDVVPSMSKVFAGGLSNLQDLMQSTPPDRLDRYEREWTAMMVRCDQGHVYSLRQWASVKSQAFSLDQYSLAIRVAATELSVFVATETSRLHKVARRRARQQGLPADQARLNWDTIVQHEPQVLACVRRLTVHMRKFNGMRMQPWPSRLYVISDASRRFVGWATTATDPKHFSSYSKVVTRALPDQYQNKFSTRAELAGSCIAQQQEMYTRDLTRMTICPVGDNTSTDRHFYHRGSKSEVMNLIARKLGYWEEVHRRQLVVESSFLRGVQMIANGVDAGSRPRSLDTAELQVSDATFGKIVKTFGRPSVDLMATEATARCKIWIGPPGHNVPRSDAFSTSWAALRLARAFLSDSMVDNTEHSVSAKSDGTYDAHWVAWVYWLRDKDLPVHITTDAWLAQFLWEDACDCKARGGNKDVPTKAKARLVAIAGAYMSAFEWNFNASSLVQGTLSKIARRMPKDSASNVRESQDLLEYWVHLADMGEWDALSIADAVVRLEAVLIVDTIGRAQQVRGIQRLGHEYMFPADKCGKRCDVQSPSMRMLKYKFKGAKQKGSPVWSGWQSTLQARATFTALSAQQVRRSVCQTLLQYGRLDPYLQFVT
eukprot:g4305.t1